MSTATDTRTAYEAEFLLRDILDRQHDAPTIKIAGSTINVPIERRFADVPSMQRYTDRVLPDAGITVRERKGQAKAHYLAATREIAIPVLRVHDRRTPWAMRELVLLHECAHHGTTDLHGPEFQERFVDLTTQHMGPEAGFLLRILLHQARKTAADAAA